MSPAAKARRAVGEAIVERMSGERPNLLRAATGAALAGGVTGVVVFRLLRRTDD